MTILNMIECMFAAGFIGGLVVMVITIRNAPIDNSEESPK